ncbi:BTB/POZ domain-containing protein POB1 [Triticum urartu]|uniref:BTB/POZ domain-containing protein POB1 n=1 Tax=Triticum urartu TaxID=4572 RepID=M7Y5J3_TRIUA|nr:BTB/POZ domain-containing protein POB1 [Triticum urartu]
MAGGEERPPGLAPGVASSFEFALNSAAFSDRVLRLEIAAEDCEAPFVGEGSPCDSPRSIFETGLGLGGTSAKSVRPRKRRRQDDESAPRSSEVESDGNNLAVIGEHGDSTGRPVLRVKHIHVSSLLLASKSPYFYKLFSNGMQESNLKEITLRIMDYEDEAFPELLHFIYSGTIKTSDPVLVLKVMCVADRFEVVDCMSYCTQLLISLPMTKELAFVYLEYECSVPMSDVLQPVKAAAQEFLADKYKNLSMSETEFLEMPLSGIKAIFSSNNLKVFSEDLVLAFLLKWALANYPETVERRRILINHLLPMRTVNAQLGIHCFGLYLAVEKGVSVPITIEFKFAARTKAVGDFVSNFRHIKTFTSESNQLGSRDLFNMSWGQVFSEASQFLLDDMLYLRAELTFIGLITISVFELVGLSVCEKYELFMMAKSTFVLFCSILNHEKYELAEAYSIIM